MIYLDTSAFIKLYIKETGSQRVNTVVTQQDYPLPVWDLHILEFTIALKLKCFRKEMTSGQVSYLIGFLNERRDRGIYFTPEIDRIRHLALSLEYTDLTIKIGCRSLDILRVAAAKLIQADTFFTFDDRQSRLARKAGLKLINP